MSALSPLYGVSALRLNSAIMGATKKPSTTTWILNRVYGSVNLGVLRLCQEGAYLTLRLLQCLLGELAAMLTGIFFGRDRQLMEEYPFPQKPKDVGYHVFPEELENDQSIFFHGTSMESFNGILREGFQPGPQLESVSFSSVSSVALGYACDARTDASPAGCVIAVRYSNLNETWITRESFGIHDFRRDPQPEIVGFVTVPEDYRHI
ncbi:hypothetical protein AB9K35_18280 [Leisingera sp. XS_AS12]|uniref:hypothetical protein n=1 Tax=Leisingera sp. XS_AS12 TaxID=3241294 RepID=UPI003519126D